jgi:dipeptidyl aminopeptidase/acylaminoacyl peptidase
MLNELGARLNLGPSHPNPAATNAVLAVIARSLSTTPLSIYGVRRPMRRFSQVFAMMCAAFSAASAPDPASAATPTVASFGSWKSPISAAMLVAKSVRFGDLSIGGDTLYWLEGRPEEQGRYAIVRRTPDGKIDDVLPPPWSARTTAHEYGGGALLAAGGIVYFSNYDDQRIWRVRPGDEPQPLTPEGKQRFADYVLDAERNRLISVCEDHGADDAEPANRIVAVDLATGSVTPLVAGADFYSTPCVSPDGSQLAWLAWNHPNMPWDDTAAYVAPIHADGTLGKSRLVAGGKHESIFQPVWSPDGTLYFVSDRTNWWNLYAERDGKVAPVLPMEAEFGVPQWVFGYRTYGFLADGRIVARYTQNGDWRLALVNATTGELRDFDLPYSSVSNLAVGANRALAIVGSPTEPASLIEIDPASGKATLLRKASPVAADPAYTSIPQAIEFPTTSSGETGDGKTAHAFYYPPANADFRGPPGEKPPLLVMIHGGPTAATEASFRLSIQYWTSRGFGVCDVNYGGSTGYGRDYRNRLRDNWGVVDVADATNAALYLADQGQVDRAKLLIRGGSAGGYTTLAALAFGDAFRAGASYYGVSDLELLATDTHKFESRYLESLVGPYPTAKARYQERSPIHHLDEFTEPVILLQGLEDKVVPPNQAELILKSLKSRGIPVAYVPFEGEQHGFRRAENIIRAQEAELYFYSQILDFPLADKIEPVEIYNLPPR